MDETKLLKHPSGRHIAGVDLGLNPVGSRAPKAQRSTALDASVA